MSDELAKKSDPANQVFTWILEGAAEHEILEAIATQWPGEKTKPLVVAAFERIAKSAEADESTVRGWCIEASRSVYQKALVAGDFGAALRAIKQIRDFAR